MTKISGSVSDLVHQARSLGAWLIADGDVLRVRAPSPLPDEIRNSLRRRKAEVLQHLIWEGTYSTAVTALQDVESVGTVLLWDADRKELLAVCRGGGIGTGRMPPGSRRVSSSELLRMIRMQTSVGEDKRSAIGGCGPTCQMARLGRGQAESRSEFCWPAVCPPAGFRGSRMRVLCPNCGKTVVVGGLGRKRLDISLKNICEALRVHGNVAAAAKELGCSQGYIFNRLKAHGIRPKDIIDGKGDSLPQS